jgi:PKD repeat protein
MGETLKEYALAGVGMLLIILGVSMGAFAFLFPARILTLQASDTVTYRRVWTDSWRNALYSYDSWGAGTEQWTDAWGWNYNAYMVGFKMFKIPENITNIESVVLSGTIVYHNLVVYGTSPPVTNPGDSVAVTFKMGFIGGYEDYLEDGRFPKGNWTWEDGGFPDSRILHIMERGYLGEYEWDWYNYTSVWKEWAWNVGTIMFGSPNTVLYEKDITYYVNKLLEQGKRDFVLKVEPVSIFWDPPDRYTGWEGYWADFNLDLVINGQVLPVPDFYYVVENRKTVFFYDRSYDLEGEIGNWHWDFGDGTSSTERNPVHAYENIGVYPVTLEVTDNNGLKNSVTKLVDLTVLHMDYYWLPENPLVGDNVVFYDMSRSSAGPIVTRIWDFGDGTVDIENQSISETGEIIPPSRAVCHIYNKPGDYAVKLTIIDTVGNIGTITKVVNVAVAKEAKEAKEVVPWWLVALGMLLVCIGSAMVIESTHVKRGGIYRWRM